MTTHQGGVHIIREACGCISGVSRTSTFNPMPKGSRLERLPEWPAYDDQKCPTHKEIA